MPLSTCSKLPIEVASPTTPSPLDALQSASGEDVAGDVSSPDADLNASNGDGVVGDVVSMGSLLPVDRATALTYFHVCAKEDLSSMTGSPQVGVYVKWLGMAACAI